VAFADHTEVNPDFVFRWFDAAGRLTTMQNRRGYQWLFDHDDAGRPELTQSPLGRQWISDYDTQGRLSLSTEPSGQNVVPGYDSRDRVTTRTFKNANGTTAASVVIAPDANGNVLTVTEGANVLTRTYDQRDRVLSYTNAESETLGYRYDASGNLVQLIYPGGRTVVYAYDNRERLTTVTDWSSRVTTLSWDDAGRLLKVARPNGTYRDYQYDAAGRMIQVAERKANKRGICVVRFTLDAAGRPTHKLTLPVPQAAGGIPAMEATYDADNRMATVAGYSIPHNTDGNMQANFLPLSWFPVAEFDWDTRNRLTNVWEEVWAGETFLGYYTSQFVYDAEGHRTHQTNGGSTTRYTVNPHGMSGMSEVLIEHRPDNTKRWYIWAGPAGLLYESQTNGGGTETAVRFYHSDQVGSTLALTDASANVTGRVEYSPYGMITHTEGVIDTPYLFNGAFGVQTDAETGLHHMRARYYHPWLARFISEDPIGFSGGSNWYAFTAGDPVMSNDPSGLVGSAIVPTKDGWVNGWTGETGMYTGHGTPFAPLDGLNPSLGGISAPEVIQNSYFEMFWPRELADMKSLMAGNTMDAIRQSYQDGTQPHPQGMSHTFTQNFLERNLVLGSTYTAIQNLNVTWDQPVNGKQSFGFTGDMVISDGLGYNRNGALWNERNIAYPTLGDGGIGLYPERSVIRGRWPIQGGGTVRTNQSRK
jgi:RHS repeat-associated protein